MQAKMDIRAQVSMVFHLDKCIGCHTCSIACKNLWTDRQGTEYMWWNNVETKPGTGYPTLWEDQEKYKGGWEKDGDRLHLKLHGKPGDGYGGRFLLFGPGDKLRLKLHGRLEGLANIFYNPYLPTVDDYYEPWTYQYDELFNAPEGNDQPTARPISMITGKPIDIEAGPNWDDDLGGSPIYAANDPNLAGLTEAEREQLNELERVVFFYLPRICNHCLNPGCAAACPAGAIYKRGEDGIVLISQDKCRAWRMCISGCPYKKSYFNWAAGKSEKCVLCYPRLESGHAPACFHACVGRIRYLGLLLYDAERILQAAEADDADLVDAQRAMIQDPFDPKVIAAAQANGLSAAVIDSAQKSPVYKFVKRWKLALPLHPEFRTLPMLFYVPPLLPVLAAVGDGHYEVAGAGRAAVEGEGHEVAGTSPAAMEGGGHEVAGAPGDGGLAPLLSSLEQARVPLRFMANLLAAGNAEAVSAVYRKLIAVRVTMRAQRVKDISPAAVERALSVGQTTPEEVEAIFRLTSLPTFEERFVIPPLAREVALEQTQDPFAHKPEAGFGFRRAPARRW